MYLRLPIPQVLTSRSRIPKPPYPRSWLRGDDRLTSNAFSGLIHIYGRRDEDKEEDDSSDSDEEEDEGDEESEEEEDKEEEGDGGDVEMNGSSP